LLASAAISGDALASGKVKIFRVKQGVCGTEPAAISDWGAVTGVFYDASGNEHGFLREHDGTIATFDPKGAIETEPQAIDRKDVVTGQYMDKDYNIHGFVRVVDGTITSFDALSKGTYTNPTGINSYGLIVGQFAVGQGWQGFERSRGGKIRTISVSGAYDTIATAINDVGEIAGGYSISQDDPAGHGFVRSTAGAITTFDADGATDTYPVGIDGDSNAAGYYQDSNSTLHSFLRKSDGTILEFDPPGAIGSTVTGINATGEIAGYYGTGTGGGSFLRTPNGAFTEFNIDGVTATIATGINRGAAVTGYFETKNGRSDGFIREEAANDDLVREEPAAQVQPPASCGQAFHIGRRAPISGF
jgi:hypothetical protein